MLKATSTLIWVDRSVIFTIGTYNNNNNNVICILQNCVHYTVNIKAHLIKLSVQCTLDNNYPLVM